MQNWTVAPKRWYEPNRDSGVSLHPYYKGRFSVNISLDLALILLICQFKISGHLLFPSQLSVWSNVTCIFIIKLDVKLNMSLCSSCRFRLPVQHSHHPSEEPGRSCDDVHLELRSCYRRGEQQLFGETEPHAACQIWNQWVQIEFIIIIFVYVFFIFLMPDWFLTQIFPY